MKTLDALPALRRAALLLLLATGAAQATASPLATAPAQAQSEDPTVTVRRAFDAWAAGTGGPYQLLDENARWTITGRSDAAGVYPTREDFMREVIRPFNARMRTPLKPVVHGLYRDGDTVVVHFDARGVATDGEVYENTYSWYLTLRDGRIVESVAFYDSIAFNELWRRVSPVAAPTASK